MAVKVALGQSQGDDRNFRSKPGRLSGVAEDDGDNSSRTVLVKLCAWSLATRQVDFQNFFQL